VPRTAEPATFCRTGLIPRDTAGDLATTIEDQQDRACSAALRLTPLVTVQITSGMHTRHAVWMKDPADERRENTEARKSDESGRITVAAKMGCMNNMENTEQKLLTSANPWSAVGPSGIYHYSLSYLNRRVCQYAMRANFAQESVAATCPSAHHLRGGF
jgi:hypothetical protein